MRGDFIFKPFFFGVFLLVLSNSMAAQAKAEVLESKKNFGSVKRGMVVELKYEVSNTGTSPLLLQEAEVSCSCTKLEFSKEPIAPGKKSIITVKFDTKSVWGRQDRLVYMKCNIPEGEFKLRYKSQVSKE